ncbi:hypothetical protein BKA93DRAFT_456503 [Sparassis latifolia]
MERLTQHEFYNDRSYERIQVIGSPVTPRVWPAILRQDRLHSGTHCHFSVTHLNTIPPLYGCPLLKRCKHCHERRPLRPEHAHILFLQLSTVLANAHTTRTHPQPPQ